MRITIFTLSIFLFGLYSCNNMLLNKKEEDSPNLEIESDSTLFHFKNEINVSLLKCFPSEDLFPQETEYSTEDSTRLVQMNSQIEEGRVKVRIENKDSFQEETLFFYMKKGSILEIVFTVDSSESSFMVDLSNSEKAFSSDLSINQLNGFQIYEQETFFNNLESFRSFGIISNREIIKSHLSKQEKSIYPISYFILDENHGVVAFRYFDRWYYRIE